MALMSSRKKLSEPRKLNIRKGDTVKVIAGKDKGKEGEVIKALPKKGKVTVHQCNLVKKAMRRHPQKNPQGGIVEIPAPLDISNVMLVCPRCSKPARVTHAKDAEGHSSRKCKKCGELIDG
jgi:large subunit ribosomal protein L24